MRLVQIKWIDATGADGWIEKLDLEKEVPGLHTTVGYVVKETDSFITITMSYDEAQTLGAWLLIPKVMVSSIKDL